MKHSIGNEKLGKNCLVVSREVGPTCPTSCFFLNNGCYAQKTERRFPAAKNAGAANLVVSNTDIEELIKLAIKKKKSIRAHERGDFGQNNQIDRVYVDAWATACKNIISDGKQLPSIWAYTHFYDPYLWASLSPYIMLYASVHNDNDIAVAKEVGFTRFAHISDITKGINSPKFINKALVCPEQRMGRDRVTCTGDKNTTACKWCLKGGDVVFLKH